MFKKQTKLNLLYVSISLLLGLLLSICVIAGTTKSAEAKSSSSNGFSCTFATNSTYRLCGYYATTKEKHILYEDDCHEFDYYNTLINDIKDAGMEVEIVPEKSYFEISDSDPDGDWFVIVLTVLGPDGKTYEFDGQFTCLETSEKLAGDKWLLNGKPFEFTYNVPIYMSDSNYSFTCGIEFKNITISGTVVDQAGNAVDGAKVSITPENSKNAVVPEPVITVNGAFTFADVDPSILPATLNAEKEGYTFTPVRITENDIVDGKIVLSNLVLNQSTEKSTEVAQTTDINYYYIIALMGIALCGIVVAIKSRAKNN